MRGIGSIHGLARSAAFAGSFLAVTLFAAGATAQEVRIFRGPPPAPEELADMLWPEPPLTRSLEPAEAPEPQSFGLLIQFDFNSTEIVPNSRDYLDAVGEMMSLERASGKKLVVEGHADASGPEAYNLGLSQRRARAVKQYLVSRHQVDAGRLVSRGKGEAEPLQDTNPTDAVNRRVQFHPAQ